MWERRHRPLRLEEVALDLVTRRILESSLQRQEISRDLILVGDPGCGKSTVAGILEQNLAFDAQVVNASGRRGVETVRDTIARLVSSPRGLARALSGTPNAPYRILRLEEAQGLTRDALAALRTVMDQRPDWVRFIFTCNRLPVDAAVVDRCRVLPLSHPPLEERARVLGGVLEAEGVLAATDVIVACARAAPTMRSLIGYAEDCVKETGRLVEPPRAKEGHSVSERQAGRLDVLTALHSALLASRRSSIRTVEALAAVAHLGIETDMQLASAVRGLGVRPKMVAALKARGYLLVEVEQALQGSHSGT